MNAKRWTNKHKFTTIAVIMGWVLLRAGGWSMMWQFLLVGAIPFTQLTVPAGAMLILFGVTIWLVFCQRTAAHYGRRIIASYYRNLAQPTTHQTRMPRRRFSQL